MKELLITLNDSLTVAIANSPSIMLHQEVLKAIPQGSKYDFLRVLYKAEVKRLKIHNKEVEMARISGAVLEKIGTQI